VVIASYPVVLGWLGGGPPVPGKNRAERSARFESLPDDIEGLDMDRVDYFYLPFNQLDRVARPGPNIEVFLLKR
jgi:hypothetical protein